MNMGTGMDMGMGTGTLTLTRKMDMDMSTRHRQKLLFHYRLSDTVARLWGCESMSRLFAFKLVYLGDDTTLSLLVLKQSSCNIVSVGQKADHLAMLDDQIMIGRSLF